MVKHTLITCIQKDAIGEIEDDINELHLNVVQNTKVLELIKSQLEKIDKNQRDFTKLIISSLIGIIVTIIVK